MEGEELRVFETNVKRKRRKVITRASQAGEVLGVVQADLQGQAALGGVDHLRVGEADADLQVIPGLVVQTVVRVAAPGPGGGVLYRIVRQPGLEGHQGGDSQGGAQQRGDLDIIIRSIILEKHR